MNRMELQSMYGATPESFERRVRLALTATRTERKRRLRPRTVLAIALLLALLGAVAYAASTGWRLFDFWTQRYDLGVPQAAQDVLAHSDQRVFTSGGVEFALWESIADGKIAYTSALARPADGDALLVWMIDGDANQPIGNRVGPYADLPEGTTYLEAARLLGRTRILGVQAYLKSTDPEWTGDAMMDATWQQDGSAQLINMLSIDADTPTLTLVYRMCVCQIDRESGALLEDTRLWTTETLTVPVQPTLAVRTFTVPDASVSTGACHVRSVRLELKATGAYVTMTLCADAPVAGKAGRVTDDEGIVLTDAGGAPLPGGVSMSGAYDDSAYPTVIVKEMIGIDTLPETLTIACENAATGERALHTLSDYEDEPIDG